MTTCRSSRRPRIVFLCTGNAARSVMATTIARHRAPGLDVRGAGTFSIPDLPMSQRTRAALASIGLADPNHRSHQLEADDVSWADLIVGFEPAHIDYVRRKHPDAGHYTATLPRLARQLPAGADALTDRLRPLDLGRVTVQAWEEVVDPAGGEQEVFDACLAEIDTFLVSLLPRLAGQA